MLVSTFTYFFKILRVVVVVVTFIYFVGGVVLFSHSLGPRGGIQVTGLGDKCLYLLRHLAGSLFPVHF